VELRHIRSFLSLAKTLNFSRTAEIVHLSQPALSLQIQALENELGVKLFERDRRKTVLTAAGAAFQREATGGKGPIRTRDPKRAVGGAGKTRGCTSWFPFDCRNLPDPQSNQDISNPESAGRICNPGADVGRGWENHTRLRQPGYLPHRLVRHSSGYEGRRRKSFGELSLVARGRRKRQGPSAQTLSAINGKADSTDVAG
jgi:Bacterial regulatory helix-turn-helix protein, lysR family